MRRAEIIGNISRDAEMKMTASGLEVANFTVAANGAKKDDPVVWVRCSVFGKRAAALTKFLTKGTKVFVRGEFKLREWKSNDKSGTDFEVNADEVELCGGGTKASASDRRSDADESDLPF